MNRSNKIIIAKKSDYVTGIANQHDNGMLKVITGTNKLGRGHILFQEYHRYLNSYGIPDSNIIESHLNPANRNTACNPLDLEAFINSKIMDHNQRYYIFLDDMQNCGVYQDRIGNRQIDIRHVIAGLMQRPNVDIYLSGTNDQFLREQIMPAFYGAAVEIQLGNSILKKVKTSKSMEVVGDILDILEEFVD